MNAPKGALTETQCKKLKPASTVYWVGDPAYGHSDRDPCGVVPGKAHEFAFNGEPPEYYFTNYFLAIGYALRWGKDHG